MNDFNNKLDQTMQRIWEESAKIRISETPDVNDAWMRLEQLIEIDEATVADQPVDKSIFTSPFIKPKLIWAVATALVIAISTPVLYNSLTTTSIVVERAQYKNITLADGSTVKLNAESELHYKDGFGAEHRNVTLSGEAYFDVNKGEIPFIVDFGSASVEVLGTEFNILSRGSETKVAVLEGRVKVQDKTDQKEVVLNAGQKVNFVNFELGLPMKIEYKQYPGWIYNKLILERTNLKTVCKEIERKFNVKIEFASEDLGDITVTGVIDAEEFNPVMETLATLAQRSFKFEKDTYIIY